MQTTSDDDVPAVSELIAEDTLGALVIEGINATFSVVHSWTI